MRIHINAAKAEDLLSTPEKIKANVFGDVTINLSEVNFFSPVSLVRIKSIMQLGHLYF